jgi:undecaprenyl-diphosphatase
MTRRLMLAIASRLPGRVASRMTVLVETDFELLVGAFLVVGGATVVLVLGKTVDAGFVQRIDEGIMLALRNPDHLRDAVGPGWVESAVRDLSALGSYIVLLLLSTGVSAFLLVRRQWHAAVLVLVAAGGGALLMQVLKDAFERPRPQIVPHLFGDVGSLSFPSGHALAAAAVYLTLAALLARMTEDRRSKAFVVTAAFVIVFLVGFSRVYLGVHWPSDVLAGWTAGLCWAVLCWTVTARLQRRGTVEEPAETSEETSARESSSEP